MYGHFWVYFTSCCYQQRKATTDGLSTFWKGCSLRPMVLWVCTYNYNNCLIFATSKTFHWQQIQFNCRRPTSTPLTFFAEWNQGRCLPIIPARLGQFFNLEAAALSHVNGPNSYTPQSMQNMHSSPRYITVWPSQLQLLFMWSCGYGQSDAATQCTKSFGGQQESPTQWL